MICTLQYVIKLSRCWSSNNGAELRCISRDEMVEENPPYAENAMLVHILLIGSIRIHFHVEFNSVWFLTMELNLNASVEMRWWKKCSECNVSTYTTDWLHNNSSSCRIHLWLILNNGAELKCIIRDEMREKNSQRSWKCKRTSR